MQWIFGSYCRSGLGRSKDIEFCLKHYGCCVSIKLAESTISGGVFESSKGILVIRKTLSASRLVLLATRRSIVARRLKKLLNSLFHGNWRIVVLAQRYAIGIKRHWKQLFSWVFCTWGVMWMVVESLSFLISEFKETVENWNLETIVYSFFLRR